MRRHEPASDRGSSSSRLGAWAVWRPYLSSLRVSLGRTGRAISFLTVLPVTSRKVDSNMAPASAFFPLIGLMLGGVLVGVDLALRQVFPLALTGTMLVAVPVLLTRALHVDGFMDACDGLLVGYTRERRLKIFRDPHPGAFAVIGVVILMLVKWTAVVSLPPSIRLAALAFFPCISRWAMLLVLELFPYARAKGMRSSFHQDRRARHLAVGTITAIVASILVAGAFGIVLMAAAAAVALGLGRWMAGLLDGLTGDTYGAVNEVAEVAVLLVVVATATAAPSVVGWPVPWLGQ